MGKERFYDRRNQQDEIEGLEEVLRATEKSIRIGSKGPKKELEIHRQSLLRQLEEARKRLSTDPS